ncbi:hypothetical protein M409DRAFT_18797 [Zasmidium cellare ATCC 36951]|uniref:Uncharacterized protein n=1 Tax=Zasmidium cellare ATCC 36951 TaxID=1080233 RepID=A0A6A6CUI4_ZASCE|nr:uncharacterized protein M409DRAFT_18797 [Zasmidium cellare ATCC 36951]KAF2170824.1 hypothetical protein M409DRAFT_18797 [Zasmidium cellare ATCC 36951]
MGSKLTSKQEVLQAIQTAQALAQGYIKSGFATQEDRYELSTAAMDMTNACQLPIDIAVRVILEGPCVSAALRVAIAGGWTDVLKERESTTADELVERCGGDKSVVVRIMRVLTASKIAREGGFQTYASTDVMNTLLQPGIVDMFNHSTDTVTAILSKLPLYLTNTSFTEPTTQGTGPHAFTFGAPFWKRLSAEPLLAEAFNRGMTVSHTARGLPAECFPFSTETAALNLSPQDVFLVDIGGGMGHQTRLIQQKFPSIPGRAIVQDLPHVVAHASSQQEQQETQTTGIEFQAHDMFAPQPVHGAAFYFLSAILHDWTDGPCLEILGHVRGAMRKGYSRVLVADWVLPDQGARLADACQDLWMLADVCGKERTKSEWEHLLTQAGLKIKEIHRAGVAQMLEIETSE